MNSFGEYQAAYLAAFFKLKRAASLAQEAADRQDVPAYEVAAAVTNILSKQVQQLRQEATQKYPGHFAKAEYVDHVD